MVLPSKETIKDIRSLINEVTGFEEDEENFYICEQYCLSHIMHHSYPSVNKYEVKKLIDGYVHRFFIHGYFNVADGLDAEVKKFLSHECLFKKNPEFDIQWVLLSLVTGLATNLTSVTQLPKIMPVDEDEKPLDEVNWGEYLKEGLPTYVYHSSDKDTDSDVSFYSQSSDTYVEEEEEEEKELGKSDNEISREEDITITKETTKSNTIFTYRQHIIDELVKRREDEISYKRDVVLRGNFIEELGFFMNTGSQGAAPQILSEFEVVGYVLNEFLTGENVFKRKGITNPATCSLTEVTVKSYLSSIQPYVNMISVFKEFSKEVSLTESGDYSQSVKCEFNEWNSPYTDRNARLSMYNDLYKMKADEKKSVPNVVKLYNLALVDALNAFENKILTMSEFQNSYTLLQVLYELRPSFNDLSSLFAVHLSATTNWLNEPNWLCSVRLIATLYKAVLHSSSNRMGFLFMNMLLFCFQAYLDITDRWISCLSLHDPHNEYIIYRTKDEENEEANSYTYKVYPYKEELARIGIKEIPILDHLANKYAMIRVIKSSYVHQLEKVQQNEITDSKDGPWMPCFTKSRQMIHVGHSIDILHRLDRSLFKEQSESGFYHESLYKQLLRRVKRELRRMEETIPKTHIEYPELEFVRQNLSNGGGTSASDKLGNDASENNLSDNNKTNSSSTEVYSFKTANDSLQKDHMSIDSDVVVVKDIALSDFCMKLCENDKSDSIEKSIWPLGTKIDINVKSIVNARVLHTCDIAKDVVVNEFKLKIHLSLLRNIFLFNDPHLILSFMTALFHKESLRQNCYILTALLRECIECRYKEEAKYLSVTVEENNEEAPENILQAIDGITINYQVHWPLQLVFTPRIMNLYNNIFRHLFKLHWAHETLCKLRFTVVDNETPDIFKSCCRRLELLRFWCLSSLARLRSYFMAQISTPFDLHLNSYQHLKHIIKAHEEFVEKVHSRCLLDDDHSEGKDLIFNSLIPLCCDVYQFWSSGRLVPDSQLTLIENAFLESQKRFPRLMAALEDD